MGEVKEKNMLKVGVIGAGHLGKFHLNNWATIEGIQLIGFCDPDDANAEQVASKYQIPRFTDVEKLIDACDALDIVAPTSFHFELCASAIKKGKHVFVEKPLANTMDEAKELVKLVQTLTPGYRMVFNLYVLEGMKHREIAELLGISEGTSKSNLADARIILKRELESMNRKVASF